MELIIEHVGETPEKIGAAHCTAYVLMPRPAPRRRLGGGARFHLTNWLALPPSRSSMSLPRGGLDCIYQQCRNCAPTTVGGSAHRPPEQRLGGGSPGDAA
ncbi:hypothetical protein DSL92_01290 [Billgrantia gudaonensis]|uniref:Uncharacterized protein n=1 Tax=Billgrantia gudaonensis TaxID=376427 RepID=A0A3S0Q1L2_9GAMM|nr:hypothetical protein DSL92_01290 [Halomonas gudaonensis]